MEITADKLQAYAEIVEKNADPVKIVRVPCAGKYCQKKILVLVETVKTAGETQDFKPLLCSFCEAHDGNGELMARWNEACPKIFREGALKTKTEKLPPLWNMIKQWTADNEHGLYIFGESGKCKSRMLFLLLYHRCVMTGTQFQVVRGGDFRRQILKAYNKKNIDGAAEYVDSLIEVPVLAFDDFAQDALTDNMIADLWRLIDYRTHSGKPTIILSNYSTDQIMSKYGDNPSVRSMCRRINEFSETYEIL